MKKLKISLLSKWYNKLFRKETRRVNDLKRFRETFESAYPGASKFIECLKEYSPGSNPPLFYLDAHLVSTGNFMSFADDSEIDATFIAQQIKPLLQRERNRLDISRVGINSFHECGNFFIQLRFGDSAAIDKG